MAKSAKVASEEVEKGGTEMVRVFPETADKIRLIVKAQGRPSAEVMEEMLGPVLTAWLSKLSTEIDKIKRLEKEMASTHEAAKQKVRAK